MRIIFLMMTPEGFRSSYDIEVRTNSEVLSIDREAAKIRVRDRIAGKEYEESYDTLVLSPGASPIRPKSIEGVSLPHVFTVRNVNDIVNLGPVRKAGRTGECSCHRRRFHRSGSCGELKRGRKACHSCGSSRSGHGSFRLRHEPDSSQGAP